MQYLGGKAKLARELVDVMAFDLERATYYVDPFVGAANVACEVLRRHQLPSLLLDVHPDLVMLWQAVAGGWVPPTDLSEKDYVRLMHEPPSALRGFAGFGCSFGGKWYGGYARSGARNYAGNAARSISAKAALLRRATVIARANYREINPEDTSGCLIYCDPPYAGTTGYKGTPLFAHDAFWSWADECARHAIAVYVSEFTTPPTWPVVWSKTRAVEVAGQGATKTELLVRKCLT